MPGLAVLAAAPEAGLGVDAAHLHPHDVGRGELGHEGDVEAAIRVEKGRRGAVEGETLFVGDEHGDAGAVLAGGEDLFRLEERWVEEKFGLTVEGGLASLHVQPVGDAGRGEVGELVEGLGVFAEAAEAYRGTDGGKFEPLDKGAIKAMELDETLRVGEIVHDESVVDDGDVAEFVGALGDDGFPVIALGMVQVDGDDFTVWRVERGEKPEERAVIVDGGVGCVGGVDQPQDWSLGMMQVLHGEFVVGAGALALVDHEVAAVVGDLRADVELAVVRAMEDELVFALRCVGSPGTELEFAL